MKQQELDIKAEDTKPTNVSDFRFAPIKGQPMLQWRGKRPFTSPCCDRGDLGDD